MKKSFIEKYISTKNLKHYPRIVEKKRILKLAIKLSFHLRKCARSLISLKFVDALRFVSTTKTF